MGILLAVGLPLGRYFAQQHTHPLNATEEYVQSRTENDPINIIVLVNHIVHDSLESKASDIHIEPWENYSGVRTRVNGILSELAILPLEYHEKICARIKVMANLASHEKDVPQDGKASLEGEEYAGVQLRVSVFPTVRGEKIVMRIFDPRARTFDMASLGFDAETLSRYTGILGKPNGLILLTGPTGSGKTTAIYASLGYLLEKYQNTLSIASVEDPVEQSLMWVNQSSLNPAREYTYIAALRSLLRQDPNVIMIGEIRDMETASIAVTAGMTGHLVISTLHSGSTSGVFARMINMGLEPFLLASTIIGVIGIRLVRLNCQYCLEPYTPEDYALHHLEVATSKEFVEEQLNNNRFLKGLGCEACHHTGFGGRGSVTELLPMSEAVRQAVLQKRPTREIQERAAESGMRTLWDNALQRVLEGKTTLEEIMRKIAADVV